MREQASDFISADLIMSYRFDGSVGQSNYNKVYADKRSCGAGWSLFATTVMPLKFVDASGHIS